MYPFNTKSNQHMNRFARNYFAYLLCLVFILYLVTFSLPSYSIIAQKARPAKISHPTEIRGVWLTNVASGVLFVPWGIDRAIKQLAALNFNTIYPVVWNRGYTFYHSAVAQSITGAKVQPLLKFMHGGQDVLAKLIKLAKPQGLSIIPWFEYGLMTPFDSELARRYPDWLTTGQEGINSVQETPVEEINNNFAIKLAWLNPLHPQVQEFIKGLILEVVTNYDVDGIQLDDHFGMPVQFGYDPLTIQLYQQEHQGKSPPKNVFDREWMRWRADKITDLMAKIYFAVKAVKPSAKVSLSPNSQDFAYKYYLQNWEDWIKKGLVDELILQVYRHDKKGFIAELEKPSVEFARSQIPVGVGISTGTLRTPVFMAQIIGQVELVRDRQFPGISFFYWESLWGYISPESPHQRRRAFSEMLKTKAKRPIKSQKV